MFSAKIYAGLIQYGIKTGSGSSGEFYKFPFFFLTACDKGYLLLKMGIFKPSSNNRKTKSTFGLRITTGNIALYLFASSVIIYSNYNHARNPHSRS